MHSPSRRWVWPKSKLVPLPISRSLTPMLRASFGSHLCPRCSCNTPRAYGAMRRDRWTWKHSGDWSRCPRTHCRTTGSAACPWCKPDFQEWLASEHSIIDREVDPVSTKSQSWKTSLSQRLIPFSARYWLSILAYLPLPPLSLFHSA